MCEKRLHSRKISITDWNKVLSPADVPSTVGINEKTQRILLTFTWPYNFWHWLDRTKTSFWSVVTVGYFQRVKSVYWNWEQDAHRNKHKSAQMYFLLRLACSTAVTVGAIVGFIIWEQRPTLFRQRRLQGLSQPLDYSGRCQESPWSHLIFAVFWNNGYALKIGLSMRPTLAGSQALRTCSSMGIELQNAPWKWGPGPLASCFFQPSLSLGTQHNQVCVLRGEKGYGGWGFKRVCMCSQTCTFHRHVTSFAKPWPQYLRLTNRRTKSMLIYYDQIL